MMDYGRLYDQILPTIKETSSYIWSSFKNLEDKQVETKALNSMVTIVDKTAEHMLVQAFASAIPSASFLTEEETVKQEDNSDYQWIIDPLDGTTNFIYGIPHFSISVALRYKGDLVLGIVEHVPLQETFHAIKGKGAFCNGNGINVKNRNDLDKAILVTGFPYNTEWRSPEYVQLIYQFIKQVRGMRRFGSAALDLAYVAAGRFDGYFERFLNPWDISAGALLVREAGGVVSSFQNTKSWESGESIVAAGLPIHKQMIEIIRVAALPK